MLSRLNYPKQEPIFQLRGGHFDVDLVQLRLFLHRFFTRKWLDVVIVLLIGYIFLSGKINISFAQNTAASAATAAQQENNLPKNKLAERKAAPKKSPPQDPWSAAFAASMVNDDNEVVDESNQNDIVPILPIRKPNVIERQSPALMPNDNAANHFANVSALTNRAAVATNQATIREEKCWQYVSRFVNIAKAEKTKFGIPVSITLAQGLLESDAGESRLTRRANNHFGIKTFNPSVPHVVLKDDTPKDKFKKYDSAWQSYRDHSLLLMKNHYKHLQYLSKNDYAGWAKGLQAAGYATDKQYAKKLVKIIEELKLYRFDEV